MRAILTWHSIDPGGSPISIAPDLFRAQVKWLGSGRVRVVSVEELLTLGDDEDAVALTFDDAFVNFESEAAPLLAAAGLPATLFVVVGHVGGDNRWEGKGDPGIPVLPLLGWGALARLRSEGVSLGAHSRTHPRLTRLNPSALEEELTASVDMIGRNTGAVPTGFAYPYGDHDDRVVSGAQRLFQWACTTEFRPVADGDEKLRIPRLDAWYFSNVKRLNSWGSPEFRAWVWARRQGRRLRARLQPAPAEGS